MGKAEEAEKEWFRALILKSAQSLGIKEYVISQSKLKSDPMVACYINQSYPAMLVYAYKYYYDLNVALFKSVNGGGENVARSSIMGALFGAFYGYENGIDAKLKKGLLLNQELNGKMDKFIKLFDQFGQKNNNKE